MNLKNRIEKLENKIMPIPAETRAPDFSNLSTDQLLRLRELNVKISIPGKDGFDLEKLSDAELDELEEITALIIYKSNGN